MPLDFLSTHVYGNVPLDLRPVLASYGRVEAPIWWTEWGTTPTHFHQVGDTVFAAAFLLRGMASALGPDRGAVALGGLGPLRGAGPAAGAVPRRVRAAVGG